MASFEKRGESWRAFVLINGVRRSKTFPTKTEARSWAAKMEAGYLEAKARGATLHPILRRYQEEVCPQHAGQRWEVVRIERFIREMKDVQPTAEMVSEYRNRRLTEVKAPSVRRELNLLNSIFEVARREWKVIKENPMREVKKPPAGKPRTRRILDEEVALMLEIMVWRGVAKDATREVAALMLLALETAMRRGEMLRLKWTDIEGRVAHVRTSKNGDARDVPLSKKALEVIDSLPRGREFLFSVKPDVADALFRKYREKAGLEGFTFHDTRATALTRLAKKLDVLELARMVGHRDPRSLMIYYRPDAEALADLLD